MQGLPDGITEELAGSLRDIELLRRAKGRLSEVVDSHGRTDSAPGPEAGP